MEIKFLDDLDGHKTKEEFRDAIDMVYNANKKKLFIAYPLLLILGGLGIHRFYLGNKNAAYLLIGLNLLWFIPMLLFSLFEIRGYPMLGLPLLLALLFEVFTLPIWVRKSNKRIRKQIEVHSSFG